MSKKKCVEQEGDYPFSVTENQSRLAQEIYEGLSKFMGEAPGHWGFIEACRAAGIGVPRGLVRESLWVMAARVVPVSSGTQSSLAAPPSRV